VAYIDTEKSIVGAPNLKDAHLPVFACSMGDNSIHYEGHVRMMGAVQPFISGAISKTVNMPSSATVEDVESLHQLSWELGVKAVAIYRDNSKVGQPLSMAKKEGAKEDEPAEVAPVAVESGYVLKGGTVRRELPKVRNSKTVEFSVADVKGYFTVGEFEDGTPGELFMRVSKQGSTLAGIMDALAISVSHGLQYGVPLKSYVKGFINMNFAPSGITDDSEVKTATSLVDYIFKKLAHQYLSFEDRLELGLASFEDMPDLQTSLVDLPAEQPVAELKADLPKESVVQGQSSQSHAEQTAQKMPVSSETAPLCANCGNITQRAGSCYVCTTCGSTSGCS
jgi:ribonucleoside-diphosphate reductase alpha chain